MSSVRQAAAQLARSIDDVLDVAQIDAGEMALFLGDVDICPAIESAAERIRPSIEGSGAKLVVDCARDAGVIRADPRRIGQALDHLLDNAQRAISTGGTLPTEALVGDFDHNGISDLLVANQGDGAFAFLIGGLDGPVLGALFQSSFLSHPSALSLAGIAGDSSRSQ